MPRTNRCQKVIIRHLIHNLLNLGRRLPALSKFRSNSKTSTGSQVLSMKNQTNIRGGTDDPENLIEVTVEQHALLHKQLWEDLGHWQDYAAWQGLSGRMGKEELIRFIQSKTHKGKIVSEETRKRMSDSQKGKKQSSKTIEKRVSKMRGKKGPPFGEEWKRKLSESRKARPAHNKGISGPLLGTKKELVM